MEGQEVKLPRLGHCSQRVELCCNGHASASLCWCATPLSHSPTTTQPPPVDAHPKHNLHGHHYKILLQIIVTYYCYMLLLHIIVTHYCYVLLLRIIVTYYYYISILCYYILLKSTPSASPSSRITACSPQQPAPKSRILHGHHYI